ncbi:MAG: LysM peptidoglycan-binding domain-containing protein [Neisseriaceae bacterium]|nr:LysM peptidoglycan-binding domain-containing protein [Neisseriaceae bacterium]
MKKPIITLLCAMSLAISAPSFALSVKGNAPQRYTVKSGDTLWGISGMYLNKPWKWPELWGMNKAQIKNPHLIYPGQVLVLKYVNGKPRLSIEGDGSGSTTIKLSPSVRDESNGYSIATLPMGVLRSFMQHPNVISKEETDKAPSLVAGPDKRIMYSVGDRVYADGVKESGRYLVYRVNGDIVDPDTKVVLGQEVVYNGEVATLTSKRGGPTVRQTAEEAEKLAPGERYNKVNSLIKAPATIAQPMEVLKSSSEIREGDRLRYVPEGTHERFNFAPHDPMVKVEARVVRIFNGVSEAGQYQTVLLNRGELHGLDRGTIVSLYKIHQPKRKKGAGRVEYSIIPAEEIGLAMVYLTSDNLSYAVLIDSTNEVTIGDVASNPGLDLEDINIPPEKVVNASR